ncbi:nuclear pore complex protein Nup98-Nup96 [Cryptosporidium felis]|nr:nuclear pore complex protein Nup98-Nup96 [Cryptosporidium felis]
MLGGGGFGSGQNQHSSGGLFGASTSFNAGIGQQGVSQNLNGIQQPSGGLFNTSTSLFGGNQSSGFFGGSGLSFGNGNASSSFGQSSNGLFGQSVGVFGNQQIGSSQPAVFGSNTSQASSSNSGIFGSASTNNNGMFGSFQNSFGSSGGFGNNQAPQNMSFFGQNQTNSGIFGSTQVQNFGGSGASPFGVQLGNSTNIFGTKKGTNGISFQPVVDRDSDARIMSIVYQKDIDQKKSVEELRWEDYQEKRGPPNSLPTQESNFSTSSNFGGTTFSSNSGVFGSSSQNSSNSIFGQSQTSSFLTSSNPQNSLFGSNSQPNLTQPSLLGQNIQNPQASISGSQFGASSGAFGSSNSNSFSFQTSPNSSNNGLFSSNLFSNNSVGGNNSSGLFGQQSSNSGSFENSLKTSSSLFGPPITSTSSTNIGFFGSNSNTQSQMSLSGSLGAKSLFGSSQPISSLGNSLSSTGTSLSSSNLFGSTQSISGNPISSNSGSGSILNPIQFQNSLSSSNPGTAGSNLFGQSPILPQPLSIANTGSSNLAWSSLNNATNNSIMGQTKLSDSPQLNNNSNQLQSILGSSGNKSTSNSQVSTLIVGNGISDSNKLSNNILSRSSNNHKNSDSMERGKSFWLWRPLPQYITRSNRYQLDGIYQSNVEGSTNSTELALPALATESARHNNILLTSVRRVEKTIDPQTPATFLNLLERQQQFFDAMQSPESNSNSPVNSKTKSMVFNTSHIPKVVPVDETFEDAIDDSSSTSFSPRVSKMENNNSVKSKALLNFESISRISQDLQLSKKEDSRGSIGRASIESVNTVRTPHLSQHRNSLSSTIVSNERAPRASIGLTTPRPITRKLDRLENISNEQYRSDRNKQIVIKSLTPILTKTDYFCIPSIEVLKTFSEERLAIVEDFKIIREGVGEITWPGITDLRGINLDSIVSIEPLCVSVYGDGDSSIPIGEGLNKKAIVLLKNCKPKQIPSSTDPQDLEDFNNKRVNQIKSYTEQMGARFISLDTVTWEWKFEVSHFSKYGIPCEDNSVDFRGDVVQANLDSKDADEEKNNFEFSVPHFKLGSFGIENMRHFNLYKEIKIIAEGNYKLKGHIFNTVSFRCGTYFGPNILVAIPHRPILSNDRNMGEYNAMVTLFKCKINRLSNPSNSPLTPPRRLISAWYRTFLEIIGFQTGMKEFSLELIIRLISRLWEITKKEIQISLYTSEYNSNRSETGYLRYFEDTFSLIGGFLEIIKNKGLHSGTHFDSSIREFISWWLNNKFNETKEKSIPDFVYKKPLESHEREMLILLRNILTLNLRSLLSSDSIDLVNIPRTVSLCLSIGNNKSALALFQENLQWWISTGLITDFSNAMIRIINLFSDAETFAADHIYDWETFLYILTNYSSSNNVTERFRKMEKYSNNFGWFGRYYGELNHLASSGNRETRSLGTILDYFFLHIIRFFVFTTGSESYGQLTELYSHSSGHFCPSFAWIVLKVLSIIQGTLNKTESAAVPTKLSLLVIQEFEQLGLWEWGVFVASQLNDEELSSRIINCLIMNNIEEHSSYLNPESYLDDYKWKFLINLGIPPPWLFEAMIYKLDSRGEIVNSINFAVYLVRKLQENKYKPEDLFFGKSNYAAIIDLILFIIRRLFDRSLLPSTLLEASVIIEYIVSKEIAQTPRLKNFHFKELDTLEFILSSIKNLDEKLFLDDSWAVVKSVITLSYEYIKLAENALKSRSSIKSNDIEGIISQVSFVASLRGDTNLSIESYVKDLLSEECWDKLVDIVEIVSRSEKY